MFSVPSQSVPTLIKRNNNIEFRDPPNNNITVYNLNGGVVDSFYVTKKKTFSISQAYGFIKKRKNGEDYYIFDQTIDEGNNKHINVGSIHDVVRYLSDHIINSNTLSTKYVNTLVNTTIAKIIFTLGERNVDLFQDIRQAYESIDPTREFSNIENIFEFEKDNVSLAQDASLIEEPSHRPDPPITQDTIKSTWFDVGDKMIRNNTMFYAGPKRWVKYTRPRRDMRYHDLTQEEIDAALVAANIDWDMVPVRRSDREMESIPSEDVPSLPTIDDRIKEVKTVLMSIKINLDIDNNDKGTDPIVFREIKTNYHIMLLLSLFDYNIIVLDDVVNSDHSGAYVIYQQDTQYDYICLIRSWIATSSFSLPLLRYDLRIRVNNDHEISFVIDNNDPFINNLIMQDTPILNFSDYMSNLK